MKAQRYSILHQQVGARPVRGRISHRRWMLGPQERLRVGAMKPRLHAFVLQDLVQLGVSPGFHVPVGCIDGLIGQQCSGEDRQVSTTVSAFDAVDQHIVPIPERVLDGRPDIGPLS